MDNICSTCSWKLIRNPQSNLRKCVYKRSSVNVCVRLELLSARPRTEVIHITCNMCARDLPDMYALIPRACGPRASGIHIRQIPRAHVTTITCAIIIILNNICHINCSNDPGDCLAPAPILSTAIPTL